MEDRSTLDFIYTLFIGGLSAFGLFFVSAMMVFKNFFPRQYYKFFNKEGFLSDREEDALDALLKQKFISHGDSIYRHKEELFFSKSQVEQLEKGIKLNDGGRSTAKRHKVRSGETLSQIARKYGVSVQQLKRANGLKSNNIRAGRYLKIY